jgi:glycine/D-amino acid oxidase-like deaminating enzyme
MSNAAQEVSTDATYDVIVIGAGPVGLSVAARSRAGGLSVAVVEKELVGGECSYWACIPSKAMLRPVVAVAEARRLDGAREAVNAPIDAVGVFRRQQLGRHRASAVDSRHRRGPRARSRPVGRSAPGRRGHAAGPDCAARRAACGRHLHRKPGGDAGHAGDCRGAGVDKSHRH